MIANHHAGKVNGPLEYFDFIKRRLARIYPLHLATLTFYVGIGLLVILGVMRVTDPAKYNFSELLPNLLLAHAWTPNADISFNYVSWSISAEFFVYLLFPAVSGLSAGELLWGYARLVLGWLRLSRSATSL